MIVTESDLRDQLRRPSQGAHVVVPTGARLSPSAADFVKQWKLVLEDAPEVSGSTDAERDVYQTPAGRDWDQASTFPVQLTGERPRCTQCGTQVDHKASSLTQLSAFHYVVKNHPRIRLRGQVDSLHALVLMAQSQARSAGIEWLCADLGSLAAYCRELTSAEYNERDVAELSLAEADADRIHAVTHDPMGTLGVPHLALDENAHELQYWLNLCRTNSRELEITAVDTFGSSPHTSPGTSICHALNRLSSAFYYLQLRLVAWQKDGR